MPRRYRVAPVCIGGAIGSYEEQSVNCDGDVISRERRRFRSIGAEASGRISPTLRSWAGPVWGSGWGTAGSTKPSSGFMRRMSYIDQYSVGELLSLPEDSTA
jgi:hypothetical protein